MFRAVLLASALCGLTSAARAQAIDARNPIINKGAGVVVGAPTGGQMGSGTVNAQNGVYVNGQAVGGGLTVPSASLLGGTGTALSGVTLGTGLSINAGTLNATVPTATTSAPGAVQPDGSTITVTSGVVSAPNAGKVGTVTDGSHTVTGAGTITFSGATVGGSGGNATVAISGGAGGTVTQVTGGAANGLTVNVTNGTSTPGISVGTALTGLLKGNGTGVTAATAGTDYLAPAGSGAALTGLTWGQLSGAPTTLSGYGIAVSGTGSAVQATSPTLVTPALSSPTITGTTTTAGIADSVGVTTPQIGLGGLGNPNYVWSGTALTQAPIYFNPNWSGTSTIASGGVYVPLWMYANISDAVNADNATAGTAGTAGIYMNTNVKPGHQGNAASIAAQMTVAGVPSSSGNEFFAGAFATSVNANLGGVSGTPAGNAYAVNSSLSNNSSATYMAMASVYEIAIQLQSSPYRKYGIWIAQRNNDAAQGTAVDTAIGLYNQGALGTGSGNSIGWQNGISFGDAVSHFPISATGTILKSFTDTVQGDAAPTVASLIDFSSVGTVTAYDIKMPNFSVTGAGDLTATGIDGTPIGVTTPAAANHTALNATSIGLTTPGTANFTSIGATTTGSGLFTTLGSSGAATFATGSTNGVSISGSSGAGVITGTGTGASLNFVIGASQQVNFETGNSTGPAIVVFKDLGAGAGVSHLLLENAASGGTPTLTVQGGTNTNMNISALGTGIVQFQSVVGFLSGTTGSGTQTFTNSPCTTLTTETWVPVSVGGVGSGWIPFCR